MFIEKCKNSLLIVLSAAICFHFLNQQLYPLVVEQNLSAGLAYLLLIPLLGLVAGIHLLRLLILPVLYYFKKKKKAQAQDFYSNQEYY